MKLNNVMHNLLNALIIIDIILISVSLFVPNNIFPVLYFDIFVCILLLIDWVKDLYNSNPKSDFLKKPSTWVSLIASIPFQVLLPVIIPGVNLLRYFRLLKLLRVLILFDKFFDGLENFVKKSNLHIILAGVFVTIILFTAIFHTFGSSYTLFDYFYLVVVTITTVGYGDIVPLTFAEKVISICLIVTGMFVFSLTTAGISSFLTDRLLKNDINDITLKDVKSDLENIHKENMSLKEEVRDLKDEIHELKDLLNKKD
ncbi:ion channel [uncultured Methanobrevibacter sp.]|uniref:ion channel n=1 Tax=uncultured Methanobrevibacter sp. TaxID=253161 RepID=UPI001E01F336|nr:ion channel [uncultured Methanobrevibacter sp.]MBE6491375.1 potassium channel protein [Methanobrevibacter sp.]